MKYETKVKYRHTIEIGNEKSVVIEPGGGSMSDDEAQALANTPWGKRLMETGFISFEKPVCAKAEKQRGMTIFSQSDEPQSGTPSLEGKNGKGRKKDNDSADTGLEPGGGLATA